MSKIIIFVKFLHSISKRIILKENKKIGAISSYFYYKEEYSDEIVSNKKAMMHKLLDEKIEKLETRLSELKEAKEFLMTGK